LFCLPFLRFWSSESENYKNYTEINVTAAAVAGEENWIEINGHPAAKTTNQLKSSKQTTKASCSMDARASPSATATPSGTTNCGKFKTLLAEGAPHSRCQTRQVLLLQLVSAFVVALSSQFSVLSPSLGHIIS